MQIAARLIELREGLAFAWDAIRDKLRSILTTLGIVIGVLTVTLMGTAIEGMHRAFVKSVSAIGGDVLYAHRRSWFIESAAEWRRMEKRRPITLAQARAVEKQMKQARAVAPVVDAGLPIKFRNRESTRVQVIGTTEQFLLISSVGVAQGRFLTPSPAAAIRRCRSPGIRGRRIRAASAGSICSPARRSTTRIRCTGPVATRTGRCSAPSAIRPT